MSKTQPIVWKPKLVEVSKIKPTPNNYKLKTEIGKKRLSMSMSLFGNASTVIVNTDYHLIDGNSRLEEERSNGTKRMWVMWPSRKLTPKEYQEMSAMFDFAVAGSVDIERINNELGTSKEFFAKWNQEIPLDKLNAIGKKGGFAPDVTGGKASKALTEEVVSNMPVSDIRMVQLFFSSKQEEAFRVMEEKFAKKFPKLSNTTDRVFKAFEIVVKGK